MTNWTTKPTKPQLAFRLFQYLVYGCGLGAWTYLGAVGLRWSLNNDYLDPTIAFIAIASGALVCGLCVVDEWVAK